MPIINVNGCKVVIPGPPQPQKRSRDDSESQAEGPAPKKARTDVVAGPGREAEEQEVEGLEVKGCRPKKAREEVETTQESQLEGPQPKRTGADLETPLGRDRDGAFDLLASRPSIWEVTSQERWAREEYRSRVEAKARLEGDLGSVPKVKEETLRDLKGELVSQGLLTPEDSPPSGGGDHDTPFGEGSREEPGAGTAGAGGNFVAMDDTQVFSGLTTLLEVDSVWEEFENESFDDEWLQSIVGKD